MDKNTNNTVLLNFKFEKSQKMAPQISCLQKYDTPSRNILVTSYYCIQTIHTFN